MGNNSLTSSPPPNVNSFIFSTLEPTNQQFQLGQVAILPSQQTCSFPKYFLLRKLSVPSLYPVVSQLQSHKPIMLAQIVHIQPISISTLCSTINRIQIIFQHSAFTLKQQIQQRCQNSLYQSQYKHCHKNGKKYFDYVDICQLIIGCVRALEEIEDGMEIYGRNGDIHYRRVFLHPGRILVLDSGVVKIVSPFAVGEADRLQYCHDCYYSPEKLRDWDYGEDQKCCVFQLGMTLIHAITLRNCKDCYNGFEVKQDQIDRRIQQIYCIYQDSLICQIVSKMTKTFRAQRSNIRQALQLIKQLECKMISKLTNQNEINKQTKTIQNQLQSFHLSTQTYQSKMVQCEQDDKQNQMCHSNREYNTSLKYSGSFTKQIQQFRQKQRYINSPKFMPNISLNLNSISNSNSNLKLRLNMQNVALKCPALADNKQSCIITNQLSLPYANIVLISSHSISAYEDVVKYNQSVFKVKERGPKESYQYGDQLANGILYQSKLKSKDSGLHHQLEYPVTSIQTEIEDNQIMPENLQTQYDQVPPNNMAKFQWKRTQFNKKNNKSSINKQRQPYHELQRKIYNFDQLSYLIKTQNKNKYKGKNVHNISSISYENNKNYQF